jgi:hypothetical protein
MNDANDLNFHQHNFSLRLNGFLHMTISGRYRLALKFDDDRLFLGCRPYRRISG